MANILDLSSHVINIFMYFTDPPVVGLSLGSNLEASDIKEGDDVYFECNMTANPPALKVTWKKDVRTFFNTS